MADVEVEVEVEDANSVEPQQDSPTEARLIDSAVDAGKSAGTAELHQQQAERHAESAQGAAIIAADSAAMAQDGADRSERILQELAKLTEQNAKILAMNASLHSQSHANDALDDIVEQETKENIEVEPEREHFLTKKWNFGFGGKK